jgi:nicotinamidase-related amidase
MLVIVDHQEGLFNLARDWGEPTPIPVSRLLPQDVQSLISFFPPTTDATLFKDAVFAHAAIAKVFDLPVVMTTSAEKGSLIPPYIPDFSIRRRTNTSIITLGPNGPLPQEILDMYPDAPLIARPGEVDAWDNADFRAAIKATNKTQIILAGIVTDVCTLSPTSFHLPFHNMLIIMKKARPS